MFTSLLLIFFFNFVTFWNSKCNESDLHLTIFCVSWTCFGFFLPAKHASIIWGLTFQNGICLQDLLLNPGVLTADRCQELQNQFCALCLPCSGLTTAKTTGIEVSESPAAPLPMSLCLQRDCSLCAYSFSTGRTRPLRMGFQHPKDWL